VCCVGSGLCNVLITYSEESYLVCVCLIVRDLETSTVRQPRPNLGCCNREREREREYVCTMYDKAVIGMFASKPHLFLLFFFMGIPCLIGAFLLYAHFLRNTTRV